MYESYYMTKTSSVLDGWKYNIIQIVIKLSRKRYVQPSKMKVFEEKRLEYGIMSHLSVFEISDTIIFFGHL